MLAKMTRQMQMIAGAVIAVVIVILIAVFMMMNKSSQPSQATPVTEQT